MAKKSHLRNNTQQINNGYASNTIELHSDNN